MNIQITSEQYFLGFIGPSEKENIGATIIFDFFRYLHYYGKLNWKKIPVESVFLQTCIINCRCATVVVK